MRGGAPSYSELFLSAQEVFKDPNPYWPRVIIIDLIPELNWVHEKLKPKTIDHWTAELVYFLYQGYMMLDTLAP